MFKFSLIISLKWKIKTVTNFTVYLMKCENCNRLHAEQLWFNTVTAFDKEHSAGCLLQFFSEVFLISPLKRTSIGDYLPVRRVSSLENICSGGRIPALETITIFCLECSQSLKLLKLPKVFRCQWQYAVFTYLMRHHKFQTIYIQESQTNVFENW